MNLENMVESGDAIAMDLFLKAMQYRCFLDTRFCDYLDLTIVDDVDRCLDFFRIFGCCSWLYKAFLWFSWLSVGFHGISRQFHGFSLF